jgi:plasmid stabilization system protein ParE
MARAKTKSKSSYTDKQKRKAKHIEDSYQEKGVAARESQKRAWATVNKRDNASNRA